MYKTATAIVYRQKGREKRESGKSGLIGRQFLDVLIYIIIGAALVWFGLALFAKLRVLTRGEGSGRPQGEKSKVEVYSGGPQTCPVCSAKLSGGEQVKSAAFPSTNGGKDRTMHIRGCVHCLNGGRERVCPVCGLILKEDEVLIARLTEQAGGHSHVHILGCTQCKGPRLKRQN